MKEQSLAVRCHTQGQGGDEWMDVRSNLSLCGDIEDGVSVKLATVAGCFVVSWEDFLKAFREAAKTRGMTMTLKRTVTQ